MSDEQPDDQLEGDDFSSRKTVKTASISKNDSHKAYWRANLKYLAILLSIWFIVSYGCAIIFADALDKYSLFGSGFNLGFWFGQQGSIYVFVILIWVYVYLMNKLDKEYDVAEDDE